MKVQAIPCVCVCVCVCALCVFSAWYPRHFCDASAGSAVDCKGMRTTRRLLSNVRHQRRKPYRKKPCLHPAPRPPPHPNSPEWGREREDFLITLPSWWKETVHAHASSRMDHIGCFNVAPTKPNGRSIVFRVFTSSISRSASSTQSSAATRPVRGGALTCTRTVPLLWTFFLTRSFL